MQVNVKFLDNLRLEASFDDFSIISDQPIRYKGDGTAPGPYDYFLASSALCAAYFVKVYCKARNIPTDDIYITQNNIIDPENRYNQALKLEIQVPDNISDKDRKGMIAAMDRCTVKRVIQNEPEFIIKEKSVLGSDKANLFFDTKNKNDHHTQIIGKDLPLEDTIANMTKILEGLGINIEIASWRNLIPHVWSVHIRDADSPMCYTNGKGATKEAALASALGEYLERISNNYFYNDFFLGSEVADGNFVHYPDELWFTIKDEDHFPAGLMDEYLLDVYGLDGELKPSHLIDTNSGNKERGICAIPFTRHSDGEKVFIPVNLIGNLFVSNGMSAGNTKYEARVQCLSEIFERAVKNQIITEEITLPDVPQEVLKRYPNIMEGIKKLEEQGFPIVIKDASLGGQFPVMCVTLMNPKNGGVFASFGAHPKFEVALERSLTELLQGRSFEGMNDVAPPTFNSYAICEHNNIVDHFIDSTGVISWKFFSSQSDYEFVDWDFAGSTQEEYHYLIKILEDLEKEIYIADYNDLGACACRILVPDFSEIYEADDLIWDNHNRALEYREDILNLHILPENKLKVLISKLEESELDDYMPISELIGIAFEEASVWGQLNIGELKGLIYLALKEYEIAKQFIEMQVNFNDNLASRKMFFRLLNTLLDIELRDDLDEKDYLENLARMFGADLLENARKSITGEVKFFGLTRTDSNLTGLDKHQRLIESYKKLIKARTKL
jgi:ribosomal protein S12 methylthiotransferase accessory factor